MRNINFDDSRIVIFNQNFPCKAKEMLNLEDSNLQTNSLKHIIWKTNLPKANARFQAGR